MFERKQNTLMLVENIAKYYPVTKGIFQSTIGYIKAVDDVTLKINKGEVLGLVGESGCGKSTLGRLIALLEKPTEGKLSLHGKNVLAESAKNIRLLFSRKVQIIFQDPYSSLNPRQTVGSIIGEGLEIHGIGKSKQRKEKVLDLMNRVGLHPEHYSRYPHEFSGGQRQRIGIARALAVEPELIVCDEPLSSLDVSIQAQVINLLLDIRELYGLAYMLISHDLKVVKYICDKVAVMYVGKLVETGTNSEVYESPLHPYTKALLEAVPKMTPGNRPKTRLLKGDVPDPASPPSGCCFHPRCRFAFPACKKQMPELRLIDGTHYVRCWLFEENAPI